MASLRAARLPSPYRGGRGTGHGKKLRSRRVAADVIDVPLSVLDLSPVAAGTTAGQALRQTTVLAQRAEELGYHRFWVAEHHNMPAIASSAPAVLLAHLAAATSTIRVGSGGVMLPNTRRWWWPSSSGRWKRCTRARGPGHRPAPGTDQPHRPRAAAHDGRAVGGGVPGGADGPDLAVHRGGRAVADPGHARRGDMPAIWLLGSSGSALSWPGCWDCRSRSHITSAQPTPSPHWPFTGITSGPPGGSSAPTRWSPSPPSAPTPTSARSGCPGPPPCRSCSCAPAARSRWPPRRSGRLPLLRARPGDGPAALRRPGHRLAGYGAPAADRPPGAHGRG